MWLLTLLGAVLGALLVPAAGHATPSPGDLGSQLTAASAQLETVVEQYDAGRERLAATQRRRTALLAQLAPVRLAVLDLQDDIGRYAAAAYMTAGTGPVAAVLAGGSPTEMLDRLATLDHLAVVNRRQTAGLAEIERRYQSQQAVLDGLVAAQTAQQADLATKRDRIQAQIAQLTQMRLAMYGTVTPYLARDPYVPPYLPGPAGVAIRFAMAQLGKPYSWGAAGPESFDCSGLTMAAWRTAGVGLPHSSVLQWGVVHHVTRAELQPGDLVFYYRNIQHVAMYVGDGKVVQAPNFGERVSIAPIGFAPIYGYGRP
jgi:cell wall-associated NlpC family hydrolase